MKYDLEGWDSARQLARG